MKQLSLAHLETCGKKRITRKEKNLSIIEQAIPWQQLLDILTPYYHLDGRPGRPPKPLLLMLRFYILSLVFGFSDELAEDSLYDVLCFRDFVGLDLSREDAPDATTLENFRHLLEKNNLAKIILNAINESLAGQGLLLKQGTIVDATIISAPTSTKNKDGKRDEEMHSTKKGNNYYYGMKAHIGVDQDSGLVHSVEVTAANVHDVSVAGKLLHGEEQEVYGDAGYTGISGREEMKGKRVRWQIMEKRGKLSKMVAVMGSGVRYYERLKASVRAKVEHVFGMIKGRFGYRKTRYRGLKRNGERFTMLCVIGNCLRAASMRAKEHSA